MPNVLFSGGLNVAEVGRNADKKNLDGISYI